MSHTGDKTTKPRVTPVFNWNGWSGLTVSDLRTDPVSCEFFSAVARTAHNP